MQKFDYIVIGSGIAGLAFTLDMAERYPDRSIALIAKKTLRDNNTRYAQGGIAGVISSDDSFANHVKDTLVAGAGLCNREVVESVIAAAPNRIEQLVTWGVQFDTNTTPSVRDDDTNVLADLALGREGGHSQRRIVHSGDSTGAAIHETLLDKVMNCRNVKCFEQHSAIDLISKKNNNGTKEICGVFVLDGQSGNVTTFAARATILACGGAGKVYLYTSNSDIATGDGIAMSVRADAPAVNMEFFQFHPTCLFHPKAKSFLITEAMRGEGAHLVNDRGERFMDNYHPLAELAPRDIVARAIDAEMKRSGADCVYLDISFRDADFIKGRFPMIYRTLLEYGFDLTKDLIPVVPAAHYCCGGIQSDLHGRTSLRRLYVIGEVAHTGLHGANRLASNSLLEALVYAHNAFIAVQQEDDSPAVYADLPEWDHLATPDSPERVLVSHLWDELRRTMWNLVGIVRSDKRLALAAKRITTIKQEVNDYYWNYRVTSDLIELRNLALVAELIVTSAQKRRESRGLHFNLDCPESNDSECSDNAEDTVVTRQELSSAVRPLCRQHFVESHVAISIPDDNKINSIVNLSDDTEIASYPV